MDRPETSERVGSVHEELARLRATAAPDLTNQVIARRAEALRPPTVSWRVTDRRVGDWLSGRAVPHHLDALLAVVTVLHEHNGAAATGHRMQAAERVRWTALWQRDRRRCRPAVPTPAVAVVPNRLELTTAAAASTEVGTAAGTEAHVAAGAPHDVLPASALLGSLPAAPPVAALLDALAGDVLDLVSGAAAEATLLVPAPIPLRWRTMSVPHPAGHLLFGPVPRLPGPHGTHDAGRLGMLALYAAGGSGRLVVTGEPGAGKTSSALLLVLDALAERAATPPERRAAVPVPVYLGLSTWDPATTDLDGWVIAQVTRMFGRLAGRTDDVRGLLEHGRLALVLDGLDELPGPTREAALRSIVRSARCRVVILGRPEGLDPARSRGLLADATVVELCPLLRRDVVGYLERCLGPHAFSLPAAGADPDDLPDVLRSPLGVALVRDAFADDGRLPDLTRPDLTAELAVRAVDRAVGGRSAAAAVGGRAVLAKLAARTIGDRPQDLDWDRLPDMLLSRRGLTVAVATGTAIFAGTAHTLATALHTLTSDHRSIDYVRACPDLTWQGRLAHDVGSSAGHVVTLAAVAAVAAALRLPRRAASAPTTASPPPSHPAPGARTLRGLGRSLAILAAAAAAGAGAGAALWSVMSCFLWLGRAATLPGLCWGMQTPLLPAGIAQVCAQGAALAVALAAVVLLAIRVRSRGDLAAVLVATGTAGGALGITLLHRPVSDGYLPAFTPRPGLPSWIDGIVAAVDGLTAGIDIGLAVGASIAALAGVVAGSPTMRRAATSSRLRWRPAAPVRTAGIAVLLAVTGTLTTAVASLSATGRGAVWLLTAVTLPAALAILTRGRHRAAPAVRTPVQTLADDRRFGAAVFAATVVACLPAVLGVVLRPDLGIFLGDDPASRLRVAVCVVTTAVICAAGLVWAVASFPLLMTIDAALSCTAHGRVRVREVLRAAHAQRLLWTVGPAYRFRHERVSAHLALRSTPDGVRRTVSP